MKQHFLYWLNIFNLSQKFEANYDWRRNQSSLSLSACLTCAGVSHCPVTLLCLCCTSCCCLFMSCLCLYLSSLLTLQCCLSRGGASLRPGLVPHETRQKPQRVSAPLAARRSVHRLFDFSIRIEAGTLRRDWSVPVGGLVHTETHKDVARLTAAVGFFPSCDDIVFLCERVLRRRSRD